MRKQIAAANWKMNCTLSEAESLLADVVGQNIQLKEHQEVIFAVPFPFLSLASDAVKNKRNYFVAAQNCHHLAAGAYTGEVSAAMLQSLGIRYCIVGHSERREYFHETNALLAQKTDICLDNGITPVFCCGEPLSVREAGTQNTYVETQLRESLFHLDAAAMAGIVIAYEPIWAIGTGKTATTAQAQEMHAWIRSVIAGKYGGQEASKLSILYGGSVKPTNSVEIFGATDVDGGLVGGASLVGSDFAAIIRSLK